MLYALRVNLSVAIVAMVNLTALEKNLLPTVDPLLETCPRNTSTPTSGLMSSNPDYGGEFDWDENTQGTSRSGILSREILDKGIAKQ